MGYLYSFYYTLRERDEWHMYCLGQFFVKVMLQRGSGCSGELSGHVVSWYPLQIHMNNGINMINDLIVLFIVIRISILIQEHHGVYRITKHK